MERLTKALLIVALAVLGMATVTTVEAATCTSSHTGPSVSGGQVCATATVTCSPAASRIRVWGNLTLNGVQKASNDVTCRNTTTCRMTVCAAGTSTAGWWFSYQYNYDN